MAPTEKKEKEKLPVHPNLSEIQARIDLALAKRAAIVDSWVEKYDTSRCAPDRTEDEIKAWDAELYNQGPSYLGLGAAIPKEYLDGDGNRAQHAGNAKLRNLMIGGLKASKKRDEREKEESRKRAKAESSDEDEEGRASMVKSKNAKKKSGEKPAVEKVNKALLAMQQQQAKEEQDTRSDSNPWKSAPRPLKSVMSKKKEKKLSKHAQLLTELGSAAPTPATITVAATMISRTTATISTEPAASISSVAWPAPLNAAALALKTILPPASSAESSITSDSITSGSPGPSTETMTPEQNANKERMKLKKKKQKEKQKKEKAAKRAALAAAGGAPSEDVKMKDA